MRLAGGLDAWWSNPETRSALCYALEYRYTEDGLDISRLKGCDYQRTRFVADVCGRDGRFQVFLAHLHKVVKRANDEGGEDDEEMMTQLGPIKTLEGFKLKPSQSLVIPEDLIIKSPHYPADLWEPEEQRHPDVQFGGEYLGNQHDDLTKTYTDTVCESNL